MLSMLIVLPSVVLANAEGKTHFSGKLAGQTCNSCHSGGSAPAVEITGPATLMPGASGTYTVKVTGGAGIRAGFNAAASAGTFIAGTGTKVMDGEVTHSAPSSMQSGSGSTFSFTYTAPATAATVTLYAAGLSADGATGDMGDMAGTATLSVAVGGGGAGGGGGSTPVTPTPVNPTPTNPTTRPGSEGGVIEGGCSMAGGAPLLLLALALIRRRRS